jgi:hypothetical protein
MTRTLYQKENKKQTQDINFPADSSYSEDDGMKKSLFRTRGLDCASHFYTLSRAVLTLSYITSC